MGGYLMKEKPTPPEEWECCESNCSPCVWDSYYEELREWNVAQKAAETSQEVKVLSEQPPAKE
ncbi:hypothetical protein CBF23_002525 [Marinomonas agarivorans]|nr:hypothetical protein CBF23_002525 [Marinomonas agarivorans]